MMFDRLNLDFNNFREMLGKTAYMSMYSSMWSNMVRSGGYSGWLLMTYSFPSLGLNPIDSLIFLLDFMGPCLMSCFGILWGFRSELWIGGSER